MNISLTNLWARIESLTTQEDGQDLIEYALVVALIAFAATAGMSSLASAINTAFGAVGTTLSANI